ncbi:MULTISPECIES: hypothetical protein [Stenotrophomonas maltophilia group]|uniref:hypothetical protein n=1 Tax=Stenotrophomonas maltophilia group TaxID=995085 RepID=UPI001F1BCA46|nr:hypothetical protein [Stenotrophomonas maltophilia]MCF3495441.1 hypothetical protein [Stenotrophomonas maltophilia]
MYQLTNDPDVIRCVDTGAFIPRGHYLWPTEWLENNTPLPKSPPDPGFQLHTPAHYRYIRDQAFGWMRGEAVERGYDSIESCASYYNSGVERYRLEARAMVAWRDAVNQALEQLVLAPPEGIDTWDEVRALLPQPETFAWPKKAELPLDTGSPDVVL